MMSGVNDDMWEQIELNNYGKGKLVHIVNKQEDLIRSLYEQIQQAHREGWEQGKTEAQRALCEICCYNSADNPVPDECTTCFESDAIAAMEYGGEK